MKKINFKTFILGIVSLVILCAVLAIRLISPKVDYETVAGRDANRVLVAIVDGINQNDDQSDNIKEYTFNDNSLLNVKNMISLMKHFKIDKSIQKELLNDTINKGRKVSFEEFVQIVKYICDSTNCNVIYEEVAVIATNTTSNEVRESTVLTDKGVISCDDISLDAYLDRKIGSYIYNNSIVLVTGITSLDVCYENIWVYSANNQVISTYIDGVNRDFYPDGIETNVSGVMADIYLSSGRVNNLGVKTDTVRGKVLSTTKEYVELDGYGKIPYADKCRFYKNVDGFSVVDYNSLLVGYELQEFIVADGKVSGAIINEPFRVQNIRVLIRSNGFENTYHTEVEIGADCDFDIYYGSDMSKVNTLNKNDTLLLNMNSQIVSGDRIRIVPKEKDGKIAIKSLQRSQGVPYYPGTIEICSGEEGLYIVNEVSMEEYLKRVVPSEMPAGYGKEAAKVQAVCARSYAYNQLQNNDYSEVGAHIDDSTWYQVYNNTETYKASNEGVDETSGEVMTINGEVITAYYYSTSCGHGSDISIWGNEPETCPYITAHTINENRSFIDLRDNDAFYNFISTTNSDDFDSSFPLYRWRTKLSMKEINNLYKDKANVGEITAINVIERLNGGIVNELEIIGTAGKTSIKGESKVRGFLGSGEINYTNNNNKKFSMKSMPSGFFAIVPTYEKKKLSGYEIIGGGYGHGLGMSQNGAYGMTKKGYSYREILEFFYEGITISNLY